MTKVDPTEVWALLDELIDEGERDAGVLLYRVYERFGSDGVEAVMVELRRKLGDRDDVYPGDTVRYARQWQRWLEEKHEGREGR